MKRHRALQGLLFAAFLGTGQAQANEAFTGIYTAVSGGYSIVDIDMSTSGAQVNGVSASGPAFSVALGTSLVQGRYYGAIEAVAGFSTAEFEVKSGTDHTELTVENYYGITTRIGKTLSSNTAAYAILGYQETKFEVNTITSAGRASGSERLGGLRFGLGIEFAAADRVFARFEASQIQYREDSSDGAELDPAESQFMVAAGYRF